MVQAGQDKLAPLKVNPTADQDTSDSDDHFSDAQSGLERTSGGTSPIPLTRVEKVTDEPSHGEVPGTSAYEVRTADAVPDEVAIIPEPNDLDARASPISPISQRGKAVSALDKIVSASRPRAGSTPGDLPIPITKVEKVDSEPSHGEVPGTAAFEIRKGDAEPDIVEEVGDVPRSPTSVRSPTIRTHTRRKSSGAARKGMPGDYNEEEDGDEDFGDDFDDFEEGEEDAEFGDFDDGFQEAEPAQPPTLSSIPYFPVLDFAARDIFSATEPFMDNLFPPDTIDTSVLPSISPEHPLFLTRRSASLWAQLVAPPPLQPPNWIRSRIRRLFLVSLGVPVDLDEILPASKQKKLILPSIHLHSSSSPRTSSSISRLRSGDGNSSSTSFDDGKSRSDSRRRRGPPAAPELDLVSARQMCMITDEALNGLTMEELRHHFKALEQMEGTAREVLEYWTKRTDEKLGDREAFEGVIENLVKHARKVRK